MTSNIQVNKKLSIGYGNTPETEIDVRQQLTGHFAPEFLNRIDFIGAFNHLSSEIALRIVESNIIPRLKETWMQKQVLLEFSQKAVRLIAEKGCTEKWGARNLERTVNETINSPLAKFITGKSDTTIRILVTEKNNEFEFKKIKKLFS